MENEVDILTIRIDQVTGLLGSLTNSMRQLSLSAIDLQALAFSKKHQIEKKIDLVDDLGATISQLTAFLEKLVSCYIARYDHFSDNK